MARKKLGEILIEAGVLDAAKLQAGLDEQRRWGGPLGRVLVERGIITEESLVHALAHQFRIPVVDLWNAAITREAVEAISAETAVQHGVMPVRLEGKFLDLAMSDPTNLGIVDEIQIHTMLDVQPCLAGPRAIEAAIRRYYPGVARRTAVAMPAVADAQAPLEIVREASAGSAASAAAPGAAAVAAARATAARAAIVEAPTSPASPPEDREREIRSLQRRVQMLEGIIQRDEDVIRQLCLLLIEKNVVSREEITKRLAR